MLMLRRIFCVSLDGFGNLIHNEINIVGKKNAVITYNSSENAPACFFVKCYRRITIHDQLFISSCSELLRI